MVFHFSRREVTLNFHNVTALNVKSKIEYVLNIVKFQFSNVHRSLEMQSIRSKQQQQQKLSKKREACNNALHVNQY